MVTRLAGPTRRCRQCSERNVPRFLRRLQQGLLQKRACVGGTGCGGGGRGPGRRWPWAGGRPWAGAGAPRTAPAALSSKLGVIGISIAGRHSPGRGQSAISRAQSHAVLGEGTRYKLQSRTPEWRANSGCMLRSRGLTDRHPVGGHGTGASSPVRPPSNRPLPLIALDGIPEQIPVHSQCEPGAGACCVQGGAYGSMQAAA